MAATAVMASSGPVAAQDRAVDLANAKMRAAAAARLDDRSLSAPPQITTTIAYPINSAANAADIVMVGTVDDPIVADDIASFPDRDVGEALTRITGVRLSRDVG